MKINIDRRDLDYINAQKAWDINTGQGVKIGISDARIKPDDPDFVNKIKNGQEDDIRPCIGCLGCLSSTMLKDHVECGINPDYFLDKMEWYEVESCLNGLKNKEKNGWEQTRFIGYITAQTQSEDFARNRQIHNCWLVTHGHEEK